MLWEIHTWNTPGILCATGKTNKKEDIPNRTMRTVRSLGRKEYGIWNNKPKGKNDTHLQKLKSSVKR